MYLFMKINFRLLLAAMHFDENFGRAQAVTKSGRERMKIVFPKQKQGEFTPKIPYSGKFSEGLIFGN